ncbi:hypothetical protein ACQEWB_01055 [Streptomyces sp. CA-249302]|uniref:hypothetical protein n=1 Tax=Streptomyces sp. CA-249302 TaxID=3240058 RepID=UPI003D919B9C
MIAFIFADLLILPILNIHRQYYGARMAAFLLVTFFAAMAFAGYVVEFALGVLARRRSGDAADDGRLTRTL